MKKLIYLLLMAVLALPFQACDDDDKTDTEWKDANEAAFNEVANNPAYKMIEIPGGPTPIYYKVLQSGTGTEKPLQTANVKVLYKGTYYNGNVFDYGTSKSNNPTTFGVSDVVRGFSAALQCMVVGDHWEVWIPWTLGYGANTTRSIPGYSTLVFDLELVEISQYP